MLNELVKDDDTEVRIEVYRRKDFINIRELIIDLNQEEYEIFMISTELERQKNNFENALTVLNNSTKATMIILTSMVSVFIISGIVLFSAVKLGGILDV